MNTRALPTLVLALMATNGGDARAVNEQVMRSYIAALNRHDVDAHTFRDGRIRETRSWDWTQAGRPYDGARDSFVAWLVEQRPAEAARLAPDGRLLFTKDAAPLINPLVGEWRAARPCRLYHPSFSPGGAGIVFSSDCEGPWGVYVMNADGTMPRRLTERGLEARMPRWSPDGARVVFQSNRPGNWDVHSIAADGTGLQRLTDDPAAATSPAFSPDGARLLFASDRTGSNELFVMPPAGGAATDHPQPGRRFSLGLGARRLAHRLRCAPRRRVGVRGRAVGDLGDEQRRQRTADAH